MIISFFVHMLPAIIHSPCVKKLTKCLVLSSTAISTLLTTGCGMIGNIHEESCKSYAYIDQDLEDYISLRFHSDSPVRLGIIPFSVPVNLATGSSAGPDVAYMLAARIHSGFLKDQRIPIVEILDRVDWPGKRDEFFTGNFGALHQARAAGYDLVMVGLIDWGPTINTLVAHVKIIDPENGVTIWYGKSVANTVKPIGEKLNVKFGFALDRPDLVWSDALVHELAECILASTSKPEQFADDDSSELHSTTGTQSKKVKTQTW